jgi:hypothetical protein
MAGLGLTPKSSKVDLAKFVNLSIVKRDMRMHLMSEEDIEGLLNSGDSLYLTFLGLSGGCLITVLATLFTVKFDNPWTHATFFMGLWLSGFTTVFFAVKVGKDRKEIRRKMKGLLSSPLEIPIEVPQGK